MKALLKMIDYMTALLVGIATTLAVYLFTGEGWNMFLAMSAGMGTGMLILLFFIPLAGTFTTFFHFMPPGMLIAMFCGMGTGMAAASRISLATLLLCAILFSAAVQFLIDLYNLKLRGEVTHVA